MSKEIAKKQVSKIKDYRQVFSSQAGRRVLFDLMRTHGMLVSNFDPENSSKTTFKEGERNVVLRILSIMKTDPEQLMRHIEEMENDR